MIIGREDEIAQIFQDIDRNDQKTISTTGYAQISGRCIL
jgi:hypothetical protein